jgi:hypothetical protein
MIRLPRPGHPRMCAEGGDVTGEQLLVGRTGVAA